MAAAGGLFDLLREKLQGKRFVFTEGNHDHDLVTRDAEALVELELTLGDSSQRLDDALQRAHSFRRFLQRRLEGVEVEIRYPTYTFGDVLCTHGHYLDVHARQHGSAPDRLLGRAVWSIAVGGDHVPTLADYEATTTLLTGVLFTIAQLPNGTMAQRRVYQEFRTLQRAMRLSQSPRRVLESLPDRARPRTAASGEQLRARATGPSGRWRYWNTGSWIYEPDLSSRRAYAAYVRNAWPGTAVLIDTDEPQPRLLMLLEHLNPLLKALAARPRGAPAFAVRRGQPVRFAARSMTLVTALGSAIIERWGASISVMWAPALWAIES